MDVRFAATSRPGAPRDLIEWVKAAEDLGYDRIGIADSPALYREAWVSVTQVALNTNKVPFGPWVTNPVTRHPVVTASAAAAVDELAPGRVCIGIGSGNSGVYNAGRKASSIAALREYILALRALLEEGEAVYQGRPARLNWAKMRIPIYMAAHAERSLQLAGEVADGVVIGTGTTPEVVKGSLEALADGARSVGRDPATSMSGGRSPSTSTRRTRKVWTSRAAPPGKPTIWHDSPWRANSFLSGTRKALRGSPRPTT